MTRNRSGQMIAIAIAITVFCAGAYAEKTVYKWVDENGVVHFSDAPPTEASLDEAETIVIPKSPPVAAPPEPAARPPAVSQRSDNSPSKKPAPKTPQLSRQIDITKLSLPDLDLRCEEAREKMIAPLRTAEIANCKQDKNNDPTWCEQFNADYGDGGRTVSGSIRPRMFDDLRECVEAQEESNRR